MLAARAAPASLRLSWLVAVPLALFVIAFAPKFVGDVPWELQWRYARDAWAQRQEGGMSPALQPPAAALPQSPPPPSSAPQPASPGQPAAPGLSLPWGPALLTDEELQRGVTYAGSGARLRAFAAKLLAGQAVRVAAVGGSITAGRGAGTLEASYPSLFFRWLNASFPNPGHRFENKGVAASRSIYAAPCLERLVPAADLLIVEYTVNDNDTAPWNLDDRLAYEHLVRHALLLPGQPAVVLLHAYSWWRATDLLASNCTVATGVFYKEPEQQLTQLSQYYDVPSLSLRAAAFHLWQEGVPGFKVDKVLKDGLVLNSGYAIPVPEPGEERDYFFNDINHPGPNGHQALAELLSAAVTRAVGEALVGFTYRQRETPRGARLPAPMQPAYGADAASSCLLDEEVHAAAVGWEGFAWGPSVPDAETRALQKWGWLGRSVGDWLELRLDTTSGLPQQQGNATLHLSYAQSWLPEYGAAAVACTSGCACEQQLVDAHYPAWQFTLFVTHRFNVTRHEACRIRLTVVDAPRDPPPQQHRFFLNGVMLTHF